MVLLVFKQFLVKLNKNTLQIAIPIGQNVFSGHCPELNLDLGHDDKKWPFGKFKFSTFN